MFIWQESRKVRNLDEHLQRKTHSSSQSERRKFIAVETKKNEANNEMDQKKMLQWQVFKAETKTKEIAPSKREKEKMKGTHNNDFNNSYHIV